MTAVLTEEERTRLALLVMHIFEEWQVEGAQQLMLLGLPETTSTRVLTRYRRGTAPLPEDDATLERAKHLLGIQHSLHVVFPRNPYMPSFWVKNHNRRLKGAPLAIMLEEGLSGMHRIWRHLDCTLNWE